MRNILIISKFFYPYESGSEKTTRYIIDYLVKDKNKKIFLFNIFGSDEKLNKKAYYYKIFVPTIYRKMQKIKYIKELFDIYISFIYLFLFLLKNKIDIIHIHYAESIGLSAVILGKIFNIKTVVLWPTSSLYHFKKSENALSYIINKIYSYFSDIFIIKGMSKKQFFYYFKLKKSKIIHSVNPVEFKDYQLKELNETIPDGFNILYFGKYNNFKRPDILINAINLLNEKDKLKIKVNFFGDGNYKNIMNFLIKKNHLENIININKPVKDIKNILKNTHIFVFPSPFESAYSQSLLEAIAAGRIVIVKYTDGIKTFFNKDEIIGIEKMNSKNLAECLAIIMNNYKKYVKIALNGQKNVKEKFSFENFFNQTKETYEKYKEA